MKQLVGMPKTKKFKNQNKNHPNGLEGYILVSTNWLLWLTFRRTNTAPYRSVFNGTSTSKTLTLPGLESYHVYNSNVVVWTLSHPGEKSNRKYLLNCYGKGKAWLRESQFLGSDSRCRHVPGMLPPPVCPLCIIFQSWEPCFASTLSGDLSWHQMNHATEEEEELGLLCSQFLQILCTRLLCIVFFSKYYQEDTPKEQIAKTKN